jgi:hypothetical protein
MILKVWVEYHHDDSTVIEIPIKSYSHANRILREWHSDGGFWHDDKFYPYHRINFVEIIEG